MYQMCLNGEQRSDRENPPRAFGLPRNIGPFFVIALDFGTAKALRICLVWPNFLSHRPPPCKA
jgi:hypothetical protein